MTFPAKFSRIISFTSSIFVLTALAYECIAQASDTANDGRYRPKIHFAPPKNWMNDPNGMIFYKGTYHLFYQHHPYSNIWGPMHWGHATSKDMIHWNNQPIALYPDSLGMIFSGSAVADVHNTSGFGKNGKPPLVAIFTYHDPRGEAAKRNDFQSQALAYSTDEGKTWNKYKGNPVLKNPGIVDFRDPKVMWYDAGKKWIMTLATKDRITFYSSPDLKSWTKESEFGKTIGAHGGVWECPDLFSMNDNGKKIWVLIVNLNPGGPNGGSATQYFLGDFDGKQFTPFNTFTKWLDYGPDEYAGITWSNTGDRKIFLGWMSNWLYANEVPTYSWRNALTIPRELTLRHVGDDLFLASEPVKELSAIQSNPVVIENMAISGAPVAGAFGKTPIPCSLTLSFDTVSDYSITISNKAGDELVIGFSKEKSEYFIDRKKSGQTGFQKDFSGVHVAPRFSDATHMNITLVIDVTSVELFADNGLTVMTEIFFPREPFDAIQFKAPGNTTIRRLEYHSLQANSK